MSLTHRNASAPMTVAIESGAFGKTENTSVRWLTAAGFLINARGTVIMIDPLLSLKPGTSDVSECGFRLRVPLPILAADVPSLDAVLYTHADFDHVGTLTPLELALKGTVFYGPSPVAKKLTELGVSQEQIRVLAIGQTFTVGCLDITTTPADHPWQEKDPERNGKPWGPEDCCGFLMRTPDGTIWCPGDTRLLDAHLQMKSEDIHVLMLDVSRDEYHLGEENAVRLANHLDRALLIPYHYGSHDAPAKAANGDPEALASYITRSGERLCILAPGEPLVIRDQLPVHSG